jgi:hypothetical protein
VFNSIFINSSVTLWPSSVIGGLKHRKPTTRLKSVTALYPIMLYVNVYLYIFYCTIHTLLSTKYQHWPQIYQWNYDTRQRHHVLYLDQKNTWNKQLLFSRQKYKDFIDNYCYSIPEIYKLFLVGKTKTRILLIITVTLHSLSQNSQYS